MSGVGVECRGKSAMRTIGLRAVAYEQRTDDEMREWERNDEMRE